MCNLTPKNVDMKLSIFLPNNTIEEMMGLTVMSHLLVCFPAFSTPLQWTLGACSDCELELTRLKSKI